jgi:hypothetical protein
LIHDFITNTLRYQAQQREEQFRREQARLEQERLSKTGKILNKQDVIKLFEHHRGQWDKLQMSTALKWDDFPWLVFKHPSGPDDVTTPGNGPSACLTKSSTSPRALHRTSVLNSLRKTCATVTIRSGAKKKKLGADKKRPSERKKGGGGKKEGGKRRSGRKRRRPGNGRKTSDDRSRQSG